MRDSAKTHLAGILNSEVTEAADALHCDQVAGACSGIAQSVVDGDSGAEQRSGFGGGQVVGHGGDGFGWEHHVFGVASIEADGGNFFELAEDEVAAAAGIAVEAVSAVPADAHALAFFPERDVGAKASMRPAISWPGTRGILDVRASILL